MVGCNLQNTKILARYAAPCLSREFQCEELVLESYGKLVFSLQQRVRTLHILQYTHQKASTQSPTRIFFASFFPKILARFLSVCLHISQKYTDTQTKGRKSHTYTAECRETQRTKIVECKEARIAHTKENTKNASMHRSNPQRQSTDVLQDNLQTFYKTIYRQSTRRSRDNLQDNL